MNQPYDPNVTADFPSTAADSVNVGLTATFIKSAELLRTADHDSSKAAPSRDLTADFASSSSPTDGDTGAFLPDQGTEPNGRAPERLPASVSVPGYEIESVLGRGGMGIVYKALHLSLKRTVALKMVMAGGHAGPRELARFRIEAEAVARLQHPNIVQVYEVGEADGHPYCALEFVEGGNLAAMLEGKPLPARHAAKLVESLARAMQLAHSRNVVHRDLKPANILLTADGTPKITDFGLARQMDSDSGETKAGAVMGTPSFMAPEQAAGHAHDAGPAADVYALGAILYDCLAGRPPFKGKTVVETLDQVRTREATPPSRWQASVPLDLDTICLKCLRKEPEKRYASAAELADELVRFQQGEPIQARPAGRVERTIKWVKRRPAAAALLAVSIAAILTLSVLGWRWAADVARHNRELAAAVTTAEMESDRAQKAKFAAEASQQIAFNRESEAIRQTRLADRRLLQARSGAYTWQLSQVQAILSQNPERAQEMLEDPGRFPLDLREFAWGALYRQTERERLSWRGFRGATVTAMYLPDGRVPAAMAFSRDGKVLFASDLWSERLPFLAWEVETGKPIDGPKRAEGGKRSTTRSFTLAVSPDGTLLATSSGGQIQFWDTSDWQPRGKVAAPLLAAPPAFSPDGTLLAFPEKETVKVVDVQKGEVKHTLAGHNKGANAVAWSRDGVLACGCGDGSVLLWDPAKESERGRLATGSSVIRLAFAPDGKTLATVGQGRSEVTLWDVAEKRVGAIVRGHTMPVADLAFDPTGNLLATAAYGGKDPTFYEKPSELRLWDARTGESRGRLPGHTGAVIAIAFSPDGSTLASAGAEGMVRLWRVGGIKPQRQVVGRAPIGGSGSICVAGDKLLHAATNGNTVDLADLRTGEKMASLTGMEEPVKCAALTRDGSIAAVANAKGVVRVWDVAGNDLRHTFPTEEGVVTALATDDSGRILAAVCTRTADECRLHFWNLKTGAELPLTLTHRGGHLQALALSPSGDLVALATTWFDGKSIAGEVRIWQIEDGLLRAVISESVGDLTFAPDGATLATAIIPTRTNLDLVKNGKLPTAQWRVKIWDALTGQERLDLGSLEEQMLPGSARVAFAADGRALEFTMLGFSLARYRWETTVDLRRAKLTPTGGVFNFAKGEVRSLLASSDSRRLVWLTDGGVRYWDLSSGYEGGIVAKSDWSALEPGLDSKVQSRPFSNPGQLALSPDGKSLAFGGKSGGVGLLDIDARRPRLLSADLGAEAVVAFSPDSATLAASVDGGTIRFWDVATGREGEPLATGDQRPRTIAFMQNGSRLAVVGTDEVRLWNLAERTQCGQIETSSPEVTFFPDGLHLVLSKRGPEPIIVRYDLETGGETRLTLPKKDAASPFWLPDGHQAACLMGRDVKLCDALTGKATVLWTLPDPKSPFARENLSLTSLLSLPDGRTLAIGLSDGSIRLLSVPGLRRQN